MLLGSANNKLRNIFKIVAKLSTNKNFYLTRYINFWPEECCIAHCTIYSYWLAALCEQADQSSHCKYPCSQTGDMVGMMIGDVDGITNVSITVYQHLECPQNRYGAGCEQKCECTDRETCNYIIGCHIGNLVSVISHISNHVWRESV